MRRNQHIVNFTDILNRGDIEYRKMGHSHWLEYINSEEGRNTVDLVTCLRRCDLSKRDVFLKHINQNLDVLTDVLCVIPTVNIKGDMVTEFLGKRFQIVHIDEPSEPYCGGWCVFVNGTKTSYPVFYENRKAGSKQKALHTIADYLRVVMRDTYAIGDIYNRIVSI